VYAPTLGEHTRGVLAEHAHLRDEIAGLYEKKIVVGKD
jgi:hypothetical protein